MSNFASKTDLFANESVGLKNTHDEIAENIERSAADAQTEKPQGKSVKAARPADDKLVQLSVYVPESYRKRARIAAIKEGRSVSDVVREFLEGWFDEVGA